MFSFLISPIPDTNLQPQDLPERATLTLYYQLCLQLFLLHNPAFS